MIYYKFEITVFFLISNFSITSFEWGAIRKNTVSKKKKKKKKPWESHPLVH
jgi:hypothetical protein